MPPKRRCWKTKQRGRACLFEALCEGSSPKSSTHTLAKCLEQTRPTALFRFPTSSFGMNKFARYSIWATNHRKVTRKVPRKVTPDLRFRFHQSSFGRHTFGESPHCKSQTGCVRSLRFFFVPRGGSFFFGSCRTDGCDVALIVANKKVALSPLGRREYEKRR